MHKRLVVAVIGILALTMLMAGCGGGGGSDLPGVSLTIAADTAYTDTRAQSRAPILAAKLDAGATVTVYNFKTGAVITTGTLGADGTCALDVTPGLTVAVVITGTREGKDYRLSTIIPSTPTVDTTYVADPVTTIAAEAVAQQHYAQNKGIDQQTMEQVMEQARVYVEAHAGADYSTSDGSLIGGDNFGANDSLDTTELQDVINTVPDTIDDNVVAAKNALQQMREAGTPLRLMVGQDILDLEGVFTSDVLDSYTALGDRLSVLIIPALFGYMELDGSEVSITELILGHEYNVVYNYDGYLIIEDAGTGTAGQITITYDTEPGETPAGTYTLVVKPVGSNVELTQTFSGDPAQLYKATGPVQEPSGANPSATVSISLKDSVFTTPITFNGSMSAVGTDLEHLTRITFTGNLVTPHVTNSGTYQAEFPSTLPSGAEPDDSIYDYPSKVTMSDARTTITSGTTTVTITGNLTATTQVVSDAYGAWVEPKSVQLTGSYNNTHSGLSFSGSISGNVTWAVTDYESYPASGSARLVGQLTRAGHPTYSADISANKTGNTITTTIELKAGVSTLSGTGSATVDPDEGFITTATLTLTNQSGVQFVLAWDETSDLFGSLKVGGTTVGTITKEEVGGVDTIKISYTDGTFDSFPLF